MSKFLCRYTSRKFLFTLIGAVALYSAGAYAEMVILLIGYIGVQGGADIVSKYQGGTLTASDIETAVSHNTDDTPDTSKIVTGGTTLTATPLFDESPKE